MTESDPSPAQQPRGGGPLPPPHELLPAGSTGHPVLDALLPGIRDRLAAPEGSAVAYYEDSPRDPLAGWEPEDTNSRYITVT